MMPILTYPIALAALAALPLLAAIYFFRNKLRKRKVSSLLLWRGILGAKEGGSRINRFRAPLTLLLELLALLLLVAAMVDPRWPSASSGRRVVVVLDDSASMLAGGGDDSPRALACKEILRLHEQGMLKHVRFVLAGAKPGLLGSRADDKASIRKILEQWKCNEPVSALGAAVAFALDIAEGSDGIYVVSDAAPSISIDEVQIKWQAFGRSRQNAGFISAVRSSSGSNEMVMVETGNFSDVAIQRKLTVRGRDSDYGGVRPLTLAADEVKRIVFEVPANEQSLSISLDDDMLANDNSVVLIGEPKKTVRVRNVITDKALRDIVGDALRATGLSAAAVENPDIILTDRIGARPVAPAWLVRVISGENGKVYTGPFVVDQSHQLTQGMELDGALWGAAESNLNGVSVITAGNIPLVTEESGLGSTRALNIQICPGLSTIQTTPNWPVLFWNLLQWRISSMPGCDRVNVPVGSMVAVTAASDAKDMLVVDPQGRSITVRMKRGSGVFAAETAGVYSVSGSGLEQAVAVNFIAPGESDLRNCVSGEWGKWLNDETLTKEYVSYSWLFLTAALVVLGLHLLVVTRAVKGIGVRKEEAAV